MYDSFETLPSTVILVPIVGIAVVAALLLLAKRRSALRLRSSYAWACACACPLVVALAFGATGALEGLFGDVVIGCALCAGAAGLVTQRERIGQLIAGQARAGALERLRDLLVLAAAVCCLRFAIEIPWNPEWSLIRWNYVVIECAMLAVIVAFGYFLCGRRGVGGLPGVALCVIASTAMHYVYEFRGEPIFPRDLFALTTAANVSGHYAYTLTSPMLIGLGYASLAMAALSYAYPVAERSEPAWGRALCSVFLAALTAWSGYALVTVPDYANDLQLSMLYWIEHAPLSYKAQGLLPSFVTALHDLPIRMPQGYSDEGARELQASYAQVYDASEAERRAASTQQFDELKPSVVIVMNETFDDFSRFDGLRAGYEGPSFLKGLTHTLERGNLGVSVYGGSTCNTEFETLTGVSLQAVGAGKFPYSMYDLSEMASLPKQFDELGYVTTAIHPNAPENWNRATVYPALGFQSFLDINSFGGAPWFHNGVTDKATYQLILKLLEQDAAPQFVFDVTMQNHSGYDRGNIPAARLTDVHPARLDDEEFNPLLNEYLSCIQASDQDLQWFIGQLEQLQRPVILLFFGDHQPYFSYWYNDEIFGKDEAWVDHEERIHQTVYFLWANYDIAGTPAADLVRDASPNYLGAMVADAIGAPLTEYQKAQLAARVAVPAYNEHGYEGADGVWYVRDAPTEWLPVRDDEAKLDYLALASVR